MGFRVSLTLQKGLPQAARQAWVSKQNPIFFHRVRSGSRRGVLALVQHSAAKQAYFYPENVIEDKIEPHGGRQDYVYKEGFDPARTLEQIMPVIKQELPKWRPFIGTPQLVILNTIQITQPGVDMWRMLCFAMDHSAGLKNPSSPDTFIVGDNAAASFGVWNPRVGLALISGNHRGLFAFASNVPEIPMNTVSVSSQAFNYNRNLSNSIAYVESTYGSRGVLALAQSFIQQVESQG